MTDMLKASARSSQTYKEAMKEMNARAPSERVLEEVRGVNDLMHYTAERFNALRAQLAVCCDLIKKQDSESLKYVIMAKALAQGDFGMLIDEDLELSATYEVEDAGEFARCLKGIRDKRQAETCLAACVRTNQLIYEAIARWQSKIDKMKILSSKTGSSAAETDVAAKKILQFEEAIKILRKRGELVSKIYYDTRKNLQTFVDSMNAAFHPINSSN